MKEKDRVALAAEEMLQVFLGPLGEPGGWLSHADQRARWGLSDQQAKEARRLVGREVRLIYRRVRVVDADGNPVLNRNGHQKMRTVHGIPVEDNPEHQKATVSCFLQEVSSISGHTTNFDNRVRNGSKMKEEAVLAEMVDEWVANGLALRALIKERNGQV